jgi:hypothetical protein
MNRVRVLLLSVAALLAMPLIVDTQGVDICGCATIPGLQPFDSTNPDTHPPGTTISSTTLTIPVPADGILRFSSMFVRNHLRFQRNNANMPVTILVAGGVNFDSDSGCCWNVILSGEQGTHASGSVAGVGGLGGPGGFRGGDGASQVINGFMHGGAGFGPGGGSSGLRDANFELCPGRGGQYFGAPSLIPLLGGGGGGGGCSAAATNSSCSGGGGGGGGGALVIAANGTIRIDDFQFFADGGAVGNPGDGSCARAGGGGSGGAIRMMASRFEHVGTANLFARGGGGFFSPGGGPGRIRLESLDSSAQTVFSTDPPAQRIVGPTPLSNPVSPEVVITSVGGASGPAVPQGHRGAIDIVVPVPGLIDVGVETNGIPGGTTVEVTVKARIGAAPVSQVVALSNCSTAGSCQATASFNLPAGTYVVEARATFQVPAP